jgi:CDGSH-type Zn-finger protein
MKKTHIKTIKNGPYMINNLESITQSDGKVVSIKKPAVALCRCGKSKTKPYCDGSHIAAKFKDEKQDDRIPRSVDTYVGKEITIHDDRGICSHAGFCSDGLPKVFRMKKEPWIDSNGASIDDIIKTIKKCPSGALSYSIDSVLYDEFSDVKELEIAKNGPYNVKGTIPITCEDKPTSDEHYSLCRCGHSKNKPFCNGQHWYVDFEDEGIIE